MPATVIHSTHGRICGVETIHEENYNVCRSVDRSRVVHHRRKRQGRCKSQHESVMSDLHPAMPTDLPQLGNRVKLSKFLYRVAKKKFRIGLVFPLLQHDEVPAQC